MSADVPNGWRPAAFNDGWTYRDRIRPADAGRWLSDWLARRYSHSSREVWRQRMAAGEVFLNGLLLSDDGVLQGGESL